MRLFRIRNRLLQQLYRPGSAKRPTFLPADTWATLEECDRLIEQKITPLLSGLWKE